MSDFDSFIDPLISSEEKITTKATSRAETFPCGQCGGSGVYRGIRMHQEKSHCFACRGTGFFKTDPRKLAKHREAAAVRRQADARAKNEAKAAFLADLSVEHPALYSELKSIWTRLIDGNEFLLSLATQCFEYGRLSEKQIAAYYSGKARLETLRAQRDAERPAVDLGKVEELFARVVERGFKKPTYRAEGLVLSLAGANSANAGAIYVKDENGEYLGKVKGGKLAVPFALRQHEASVAERLNVIAADPMDAAVRYGRKTGVCACCGRKLDNALSVELGIGPICRDKWF